MVNAAKALAEVDKDDRHKEWEKEQSEMEGLIPESPNMGSVRHKRANAGKKMIPEA